MNENFYKNIKYLCKKKDICLSELESEIGVSQGYFSRVRKGKEMSVFKAYKAAKALDSDITEMLEEEMWKIDRIRELENELQHLKGETKCG